MVEPTYLQDAQVTEAAIRGRMLAAFLAAAPGMDVAEGSFPFDTMAPAAIELAQLAIALEQTLDRGFAETTFGEKLERRVAERGLERLAAVAAAGTVRFSGTAATVVPAGTRVATASTTQTPAQVFTTDAAASVGGGGTVDVAVTAEVAGAAGNVGAGTVVFLLTAITGITAVTNPTALTGGLDEETDAALLARYLIHVRSPSAGGNRPDYLNWALAVAGVGGVNVSFPGEGSPAVLNGQVRLSLIGTDKAPASLAVQDAVLDDIVDPRRLGPYEAETFTLSGFGASVDATQVDDTGDSVLFAHNASGDGQATHPDVEALLMQPGIWMARARAKVNDDSGSTPFFRVGVWNFATANWARSSPSAADGTAVQDFPADELSTAFGDVDSDLDWPSVDFYWNGADQVELRLIRLNGSGDTTTQVWVDQVRYRSAFSSSEGEGRSPAGARVEVQAAVAVSISVSATLTYKSGFDPASVRATVEANLEAYVAGLALQPDNDVQYARVGVEILDSQGVQDYTGLTVNGGTANVVIGSEEVAILGTVTLTWAARR
ncbi:MAG: baseplate J/gp47 family protein [Chloroflexota bacterium]